MRRLGSKKLSIVIVAYINYDIVLDCIASICEQNDLGDAVEILLVDNSPDHRVSAQVRCRYPFVICIDNVNNGFGPGNNVGVRHASGEYLFFLNPDTLLTSPLFEDSISFLERNPGVGMLGFKMIDKMGAPNHSFYLLKGGGFVRNIIERLCNRFDFFVQSSMYIAGSAMFTSRDVFEQAGCFDENIFMYYEEPDLTRRIHGLGYIIAYMSHIKIVHLEGGATSDSGMAFQRRIKSLKYYCDKYNLDFSAWIGREIRILYMKHWAGALLKRKDEKDLMKKIEFLKSQ